MEAFRGAIMEIQLICPDCDGRFAAPAETPGEDIVRRMTDEGPWLALGDGDCFRNMIRTAFLRRGRISCPECGGSLLIEIEQAHLSAEPMPGL
jgi:hypothetical protein